MTKSSTPEKSSISRSAAMKGCHKRKRPKCTSSQLLWNWPPGVEKRATCSARGMASTTQRRRAETDRARRCVGEPGKAMDRVGEPTGVDGRPDNPRSTMRPEKSSANRIILKNNVLLLMARRLHYLVTDAARRAMTQGEPP